MTSLFDLMVGKDGFILVLNWLIINKVFLQGFLIVAGNRKQIQFTQQLVSKSPYYQGQTLVYQSLLKIKPWSNETAANVSVVWVLPSYVLYKSYKSLSSAKRPNDVSSNANKIAMKFGSLLPSEKINILIDVTVDPSHTLRDNSFHYAPITTTVKYRWTDPCSKEEVSNEVLYFPFFCSECSSFGSFGMTDDNIKDSQIQASTVQTYISTTKAWEPMTSFNFLNVVRKMKLNFLQIDLKLSRQVEMVFIDGVPKQDPIPWHIIQLSFSDNSWKWNVQKILQKPKIFRGEDTIGVAITTHKPIKTRYIRINVPPYGLQDKRSSVYKVQLYGCVSKGILSQDPMPVGIESSSLVPDSRFSSPSILGPRYNPHFGRLNTRVEGGSWCASACGPLQYLQIDLGDTWKIEEIETQSRHSTNGAVIAVKTYSLSSSLDGASWTPYRANRGTKIFWGNDVANLATRHKLFKSLTAKYVRFEPRTCTSNVACMRVELYGTKASDSLKGVIPAVVFGRSILLKKESIPFVCNSEVSRGNAHCLSSQDRGKTWQEISVQVLNVLAFDTSERRLYGLTRNGKNILKSKDPNGLKWRGIPLKEWYIVRDRVSVHTAVEIPFVPISRNSSNVVEPLVQMTASNGDKWQADQLGVYYKPVGGASQMVLSFLPYSLDLSSNPCHTGVCLHGRCEQVGGSRFSCHCRTGYTGRSCDKAIDYCSSSPCQNRGTCSPLFLSFTCSCQPGYSGSTCQDYDECVSSPCLNGGTCVDGDNKFTCTCAPNFQGSTCEDYDECVSSPCLNGGTCVDGDNKFTCTCAPNFQGSTCEVTLCTNNPCANGGTCHLKSDGLYTCSCTLEFSGFRCLNGRFSLSRGIRSNFEVWNYNSGKYDKIVFYSNANLTVFGVFVSDTFSTSISTSCTFAARIRKEGSSTFLASKTGVKSAGRRLADDYAYSVRYDTPLIFFAGTRYIIEAHMDCTANIRKLVNGFSSRTLNFPDGSLSVTYNYETVDSTEFADSNGSTQSEGGILGLLAQFAH